MADPWMKFYPSDWRSDPAVRMCSLAARGLWIEMLALMHEAVPRGHLVVADRRPTDAQLAVLAGTTPDQIPELIGELEAAAVFSRTREGTIYSRRMTRDDKKAATARKNGKRGGNPTLSKCSENQASDKGQDNGRDKTQKPEARSQIEEDGGDRARVRAIPASPQPVPTWREQMLEAAGVPASGVIGGRPTAIGGVADMQAAARWEADLGLDKPTILAVIRETVAAKRDGPPSRLAYFNRPMQATAASIAAPPMAPAAPPAGHSPRRGGPPPDPPPTSNADLVERAMRILDDEDRRIAAAQARRAS